MLIRLKHGREIEAVKTLTSRTQISVTTAARILRGQVHVNEATLSHWIYELKVFGPDPDAEIELL